MKLLLIRTVQVPVSALHLSTCALQSALLAKGNLISPGMLLRNLHAPCSALRASAAVLSRGVGKKAARCLASGVWEVEWNRKDGTKVPGYGFGDMVESANPGVIVIQEWWGVTQEVQFQAQKIADQGYRVLVPDLYRGKVGVDAEEASHLMSNLDWLGAVEDIRAASVTLAAEGNGKVGVVGFCMGGALSLASAALVDEISCASAFYGIPDPSLADMATIAKPVEAHFGDLDDLAGFSDPAAVGALEATLAKSGAAFNIHRYPTVGHAFMNDTESSIARKEELGQTGGERGAKHDPAAVALGYERLFAFLRQNLKVESEPEGSAA
jgi:carboxymethylenebutenolidase